MNHVKKYFPLLLLLVFSFSCKKNKKEEESDSDFKKSTILENVGSNLILANYQTMDLKLTDFQQKYDTFIANQSPENFTLLKSSWKESYIQWEKILMFEFGPAMEELMKASFGTFPSDTTKVLNNISTGSYDLYQVSNITAQGLPVFDFLLYRNNAISFFGQTNYAQYGKELILKMKGHLQTVISKWNSSYLSTFVSSTGTESTSAFSIFVNEFVKSYEELKWTKIGIPLGKQSLGITQPYYIEAKYSKISFQLMLENMKALQRLFNGDKEDGTIGVGFDDYLNALDKNSLTNSINTEFQGIISIIGTFTTDFETTLNNNPQDLDALYTKIHNLTVLLKTDMTSSFGIMITYQDNDGD
ncbi:MAG: imelysin family protein [Bacteroidota bacterium]